MTRIYRLRLSWRTVTILLVIAAAFVSQGCITPDGKDLFPPSGPNIFNNTTSNTDKDNKWVEVVRVNIHTIELPFGQASGSGRLWNYLDEEPVALKSTILGLNGIRVGIGKSNTWSQVAEILKKLTGRGIKKASAYSTPGKPTHITLRKGMPAQMIFVYRADGTLAGEDYPPGDNILAFDVTCDEDDRTRMLMTCMPQLKTTHNYHQQVVKNGQTVLELSPKIYSFNVLTFQFPMSSGDFIIVGPGSRSHRPSSIGHHYLTKTRGGMLYETILIIQPQIERVELKTKPI